VVTLGKHKAKQRQDLKRVDYQRLCTQRRLKIPVLRNTIVAFLVGGLVSVIGQGLIFLYMRMGFSEEQAASPMVATLIVVASLLTGFGVWDYIGQFAGAGVGVPVTGFANSIVSSALEFKREGFILGVGGRMFQLAGPIIVYGVVTALVVGILRGLVMGL